MAEFYNNNNNKELALKLLIVSVNGINFINCNINQKLGKRVFERFLARVPFQNIPLKSLFGIF